MEYKTKLGNISAEEKDILIFKKGLPGFQKLSKFVLLSMQNNEPIRWLVSLEDSEVSLPVIDPWLVRKDYYVNLKDDVLEFLGIEDREKILIMAVLRITNDNPDDITVNLLAPLIINLSNNNSMQLLLEESDYQIRHNVKEELERSRNLNFEEGKMDKNADS